MRGPGFLRSRGGSAAAEMALVSPLLAVLLIGSVELGNFFYNEHILTKAVRDGARYAARQNFSNYSACSGEPTGTVVAETRALVRTSLLATGSDRLPNIDDANITLEVSCVTDVTALDNSTETLTGIYEDLSMAGAPIVTVTASVPYTPVIGAPLGFSGNGLTLNASQQAAVMGI